MLNGNAATFPGALGGEVSKRWSLSYGKHKQVMFKQLVELSVWRIENPLFLAASQIPKFGTPLCMVLHGHLWPISLTSTPLLAPYSFIRLPISLFYANSSYLKPKFNFRFLLPFEFNFQNFHSQNLIPQKFFL